ncbi:hypothetical protein SISNIDRAFT_485275 [Sistotremastrum niveocremeum HHB9708]|uniref:Uncharacterized protein n=1 Tax=Sistotremastrum niveocremeum HHB9708 TaxID=1314777 RepID=A0A164UYU4_9AGAM|nr:hypothetical protein SISNIDRAFT_485275 [Sistotremastrum niveocremeum HHB9708]
MQLDFSNHFLETRFTEWDLESRLIAAGLDDISHVGGCISGIGINNLGNTYISFDRGTSYLYLNKDRNDPNRETAYYKTTEADEFYDNQSGFKSWKKSNGESLTFRRPPHVPPEDAHVEYIPPRGKDGESEPSHRFPIPATLVVTHQSMSLSQRTCGVSQ